MSNPASSPAPADHPQRRADHPQGLRGSSWSELLAAALEEPGESWEAVGEGRSAKETIARQLVGLAMEGDKRAIEMILDRLEGKPRQAVDTVPREFDEVVEIG